MPPKVVQESWPAGSTIYFKHKAHSWVVGQVVSEDGGGMHTCKIADPVRTDAKQGDVQGNVKGSEEIEPFQADAASDQPHDLLNLTVLADSSLIRCLFMRYMADIIYTNIGAIVVALNPFNFKIPRYMDDQMPKYLNEGHAITANVPHSWAQAHNTYWEMVDNAQNQCVLISGESGAGKTEATKIVMKYLAQISCMGATPAERDAALLVGQKLSACSPFLESFGNARTVRNDNSSRFGKFMKVKFNGKNRLAGAFTIKYLLEKSRIITAALGERCYHSFYIVVRGKFKSFFNLEDEKRYKSINSGKQLENKEFSTAADFDDVCHAMAGVGMTEANIRSVWRIPAGVLSLQNVNMLQDGEGSMLDEDTAPYVAHVSKLWEVDQETLRRELATTTLVLPGNSLMTKPNTVSQALDIRDALCKHSYDGIFSWLVEKCNEMCDVQTDGGNWIGLLDIFGFEDFEKNSFEQMCINLTNETLQNHYNDFIFTNDMEECKAEGIDVADIVCPDNGPCMQLISAPKGGIMSLLDEECLLGKATDFTFLDKITATHSSSPFFFRKKSSRDTFGIHHYAASVTYDINGWLDKNRDTIKDAIKLMMRKSADPLVSVVLPEPIPADLKKGKGMTVGGFFSDQVRLLMELIRTTNPHWIRCIKPHPAKKAKMFDGVQTMNQLESSGVLGTVKIRKAGYPVRLPHSKFIQRYRCLFAGEGSERAIIQSIVDSCGMGEKKWYQNGNTKVFLKAEAYQKLEKEREKAVMKWVLELQRIGQGFLGRARAHAAYMEKHKAAIMAKKKEKEERERAEKEKAAREAKDKEEAERRAKEAEERRIRDEARKAQLRLEKAATTLQRHTRGGLCRLRLLRRFIEEERSKFEIAVEMAACEDRQGLLLADEKRLRSERQWVAYLNNVDEIANLKSYEKIREQKHTEQKHRIQRRELLAKETDDRREVAAEEESNFQTMTARCKIVAAHKRELEIGRQRHLVDQGTHRRLSPVAAIKGPTRTTAGGATVKADNPLAASSAGRQAEARDQMLAQYALNRARAFEAYFPNQPPPAQDTARNRSRMYNDPYTPGAASTSGGGAGGRATSARAGGAKPMTAQMSRTLFERSKNEWERQEEFLQYRNRPAEPSPSAAATRRAGGAGGGGLSGSSGGGSTLAESSGMGGGSHDAFSGPFRSQDVSTRHFTNHASTGSAGAPGASAGSGSPLPVRGGAAAAEGYGAGYTAPRFATPGANTTGLSGATPANPLGGQPSLAASRTRQSAAHRRAEADFRGAANTDELMNSQMW